MGLPIQTKLTTLFEGKTTKRDRSNDANLPVEKRLTQHIIDGERLGLEDALVGITKFCVHPVYLKSTKTIVGGTKNIKFDLL